PRRWIGKGAARAYAERVWPRGRSNADCDSRKLSAAGWLGRRAAGPTPVHGWARRHHALAKVLRDGHFAVDHGDAAAHLGVAAAHVHVVVAARPFVPHQRYAFADDVGEGAVVGDLPPGNDVFRQRRAVPAVGLDEMLVRLMRLAVDAGGFRRERLDAARAVQRRITDRRAQVIDLIDARGDRG